MPRCGQDDRRRSEQERAYHLCDAQEWNGIPGGLNCARGGVNDQRSVPADVTGA